MMQARNPIRGRGRRCEEERIVEIAFNQMETLLRKERDLLLDDLVAIESGGLASRLTKAEREMLYARLEQMNRLLVRGEGGHA